MSSGSASAGTRLLSLVAYLISALLALAILSPVAVSFWGAMTTSTAMGTASEVGPGWQPATMCANGRPLLRPGDVEVFHLPAQRGALHPQADGCPFRAAQHPAGFVDNVEDVLPFGVGQGTSRGP